MATHESQSKIIYTGNSGHQSSLEDIEQNTIFVIDSNVILKILEHAKKEEVFPEDLAKLVHHANNVLTQKKIYRNGGLPVDMTFSALELSKQDKKEKYGKFRKIFEQSFHAFFPENKYDPIWLQRKHRSGLDVVRSSKNSIEMIVMKIYELTPKSGSLSNREIFISCERLVNWIWSKRNDLSVIPGPVLYYGIYAIAGSPEASKVLKIGAINKKDPRELASNVAWDFLYLIYLQMEYVFKSNENTVVCTYDKTLAYLLSQRMNMGPRYAPSAIEILDEFSCLGTIEEINLAKIRGTKLAADISNLFLKFWSNLDCFSTDSVKFGFDRIRASHPRN